MVLDCPPRPPRLRHLELIIYLAGIIIAIVITNVYRKIGRLGDI